MGANITVVGGGSYHWAPRLLADFANTPSLNDAHVVLHDLDAGRMLLMQDLGEQIAQRRGIDLRVESEGDAVTVTITPTYSGCPALDEMRAEHRDYWDVVTNGGELSQRLTYLSEAPLAQRFRA